MRHFLLSILIGIIWVVYLNCLGGPCGKESSFKRFQTARYPPCSCMSSDSTIGFLMGEVEGWLFAPLPLVHIAIYF